MLVLTRNQTWITFCTKQVDLEAFGGEPENVSPARSLIRVSGNCFFSTISHSSRKIKTEIWAPLLLGPYHERSHNTWAIWDREWHCMKPLVTTWIKYMDFHALLNLVDFSLLNTCLTYARSCPGHWKHKDVIKPIPCSQVAQSNFTLTICMPFDSSISSSLAFPRIQVVTKWGQMGKTWEQYY